MKKSLKQALKDDNRRAAILKSIGAEIDNTVRFHQTSPEILMNIRIPYRIGVSKNPPLMSHADINPFSTSAKLS